MSIYGHKRREQTKTTTDGKTFLSEARQEFAALFQGYVEREDEEDQFDSLAEFADALEAEAWKLCEEIVKRSYRNGVTRGQRRQKSDR